MLYWRFFVVVVCVFVDSYLVCIWRPCFVMFRSDVMGGRLLFELFCNLATRLESPEKGRNLQGCQMGRGGGEHTPKTCSTCIFCSQAVPLAAQKCEDGATVQHLKLPSTRKACFFEFGAIGHCGNAVLFRSWSGRTPRKCVVHAMWSFGPATTLLSLVI